LFVDPAPGPVLANYGLDNLRFVKPVYAGDTIQVRLTCKQKTAKETPPDVIPQGVVAWDVEVTNQDSEPVAVYTILTLVRRKVEAGDPDAGDAPAGVADNPRAPETRNPVPADRQTLPT
jgi:oxepin-CoA hydrolase/3-oxo-5,6-dehydrosuberyl-CoA semialdehyde dehydrogenase